MAVTDLELAHRLLNDQYTPSSVNFNCIQHPFEEGMVTFMVMHVEV